MTNSPELHLICADASSPARAGLEAIVRATYADAYGARITHLLPLLLGLTEHQGRPEGVIGAQVGDDAQAMFLEDYLDVPIEAALSQALGTHVPRTALAEVGNLSAARPGLGRPLVSTMAAYLQGAGVAWAVFTATRALRHGFLRMGLQLHDLGAADGRRLGERLADWGSYYATDPRVTAVAVREMFAAAARDQRLAAACARAWHGARLGGRRRERHAA